MTSIRKQARAPKKQVEVDLTALVARVDALVAAHGAVPRAAMKPFRKHLALLLPALVERGYETGTTIRRPLEKQLLALLDEGFIAARGVDKRVAGASSSEVKGAIARLAARGEFVAVVRDSGPGWVAPSADTLAGHELRRLLSCLTETQKLLRKAKNGTTVLRQDVRQALVRALEGAPRDEPPPRVPERGALAREIEQRVLGASAPVRVPDLLRSLGVPMDDGRRALLEGAALGLFDLEPESGMGRLSQEDAAVCPQGPMGTVLSWARPRTGAPT